MRAIVFVFFAGLLASAVEQGGQAACSVYSTCYTCAQASGCGWANGVVCYPGTASGASPPYSSNISWAWTTGQCTATPTAVPLPTSGCSRYSTCYSCAAAAGCGWANGVVCYPGNASGASYPYSSNKSWAWTTGQCTATPTPAPLPTSACSRYSTCFSCAQASGCGWANGVVCYPGTSSGASYPYSSNISWAWTTGQCTATPTAVPLPTSACSRYSTCYSCAAAAGCGWANGVVCYPGNSSGASYPYSSNKSWAWTTGQCTATPVPTPIPTPTSACLRYSTCYTCAAAAGCGWANGVACYPGSSSGASYPYSSSISWAWTTAQCAAPLRPIPLNGTFCGAAYPINGISAISYSNGALSFFRVGSGLANCRMQGSYTVRDSIIQFNPYTTTCAYGTLLALIWYNNAFSLTGTFGGAPLTMQLTSSRCTAPYTLPSGQYSTSATGPTVALLASNFLVFFDGCNVSGTYSIYGGSLSTQLPSTLCITARGNTYVLLSTSYTNLTNGYWFLTISYTLNGVTYAESTKPAPARLGETEQNEVETQAEDPFLTDYQEYPDLDPRIFGPPPRSNTPLYVLAAMSLLVAAVAVIRYGKKRSVAPPKNVPYVVAETFPLTAVATQ